MIRNTLPTLAAAAAATLFAGSATAQLVINEALVSTPGADTEFVELFNAGPDAIDLGGYTLTAYESEDDADTGGDQGDVDSQYVLPAGASIDAGGYFLFGSPEFVSEYGITPDFAIADNSFENDAFTLLLEDDAGTNLFSVLIRNDQAGVVANEARTPITPDFDIASGNQFIPAGFYLVGDGGDTAEIIEFFPRPSDVVTPGFANPVPEPAAAGLLAVAGLGLLGRRRK